MNLYVLDINNIYSVNAFNSERFKLHKIKISISNEVMRIKKEKERDELNNEKTKSIVG